MTDNTTQKVEELRQERLALLNELESAYRQLEDVLSATSRETGVAYQELRKRNDELQRRYGQLETAHAQLRETQQMLVRSERMSAMGQMAAAIVHEINNPLTAISGRVELLLMNDDLQYRDQVRSIQSATQALSDLAGNVLRFARRRQTEPQDFEALHLNEVFADVLMFFEPLMKRLTVQTAFAETLPAARGNVTQVEQVLTNFVVNAADAMADRSGGILQVVSGCGRVREIAGAAEADGRQVRTAVDMGDDDAEQVYAGVKDNGPGISEPALEHLFEAFYTTKGADRGTGLGLSICRSIAEGLQGNILVDSTPGGGACFRLFLPLATQETAA